MTGSTPLQSMGAQPRHLAMTAPTARLAKDAREGKPEALAFGAAVRLVSDAFIKPILEQMRSSSTLNKPFAASNAEKTFRPMLDGEFSDRIARSGNFDLVGAVQKSLLSKAFNRQMSAPPQPSTEVKG